MHAALIGRWRWGRGHEATIVLETFTCVIVRSRSRCDSAIHGPYQHILYGRYLVPGGVKDSSRDSGARYWLRWWKLLWVSRNILSAIIRRSRRIVYRVARVVGIVWELHFFSAQKTKIIVWTIERYFGCCGRYFFLLLFPPSLPLLSLQESLLYSLSPREQEEGRLFKQQKNSLNPFVVIDDDCFSMQKTFGNVV